MKLAQTHATLVTIMVLTCLVSQAQTTKPKLPDGKTIIEKHLAAVGGKAKLQKIRSQHFKSKIDTIEGRKFKGDMEIHFARLRVKDQKTGKMVDRVCFKFEMNLGGAHTVMGSDGVLGWTEHTTADGVPYRMLMDEKTLKSNINNFDPAALTRHAEYYKSCTTLRKSMIRGKPAYEVKLESKSGTIEHYYFDMKSGLLVGVKAFLESPSGVQVSKSSFSDYRDVDGILTAFSSLGEGPGYKQVSTTQPGGAYNAKIDPKIFAPSKEVLALAKKKKESEPAKGKLDKKQ